MEKIKTNKLTPEAKKSMITRIITGVVLFCICVPAIIFGSWWFVLLTLIISVLCGFEIVHITDLRGALKTVITVIAVIATVGIIYYIFYENSLKEPKGEETLRYLLDIYKEPTWLSKSFTEIKISIMLIVLMAAVFFVFSFFSNEFTIKHVLYLVTMIIVIAIGLQSMLYLRLSPEETFRTYYAGLLEGNANDAAIAEKIHYIDSPAFKYGQSAFLFIYVVLGVIMNDIGAYFIGILFGKHKMNEKVSPKKTWEGFLGGVVFSLISSTLFAVFTTKAGKPMLPIFDFINGGNRYGLFFILGISILLPVIADVGDFVFSAVKRYWGVKDFSNILPGHGGVLDRIDSLIFSAALVACLITFLTIILIPALRISVGA